MTDRLKRIQQITQQQRSRQSTTTQMFLKRRDQTASKKIKRAIDKRVSFKPIWTKKRRRELYQPTFFGTYQKVGYGIAKEAEKSIAWWERKVTIPIGEKIGGETGARGFTRGIIEGASIFPTYPVFLYSAGLKSIIYPRTTIPRTKKVITETYKGFKEQPARTAGQFLGMSIIPLFGGVTKRLETIGKKQIKPETIIEPKIIAGRETFPTAPRGKTPRQLIKEFEESLYRLPHELKEPAVFHATSELFGKTTRAMVGKRPTTAPGLHGAPSLSPHFLRLPEGHKIFGLGLEKPPTPAALRIYIRGFERIPAQVRKKGIRAMSEYLKKQAEKGKAYVSPAFELGKLEKEVIIPPETILTRQAKRYYVPLKQERVPILEYKAESIIPDSKVLKTKLQSGKSYEKIMKKYDKDVKRYTEYKESIITPERILRYGALYQKKTSVIPPSQPYTGGEYEGGEYIPPPPSIIRDYIISPSPRIPDYAPLPSPDYIVPPPIKYKAFELTLPPVLSAKPFYEKPIKTHKEEKKKKQKPKSNKEIYEAYFTNPFITLSGFLGVK